ncbi:MAG: acetyl-CoA hydrolase/transferase C-terminal domain-containing protein [Halioglobus sp.]|nr:acetyl-CoA hydrolase/transferase C-terminal domain-containing protein [Halioglobus sp.]
MTMNFDNVDACVDFAIERVGKRIVLGAPLGLGKPTQLMNAFFQRAVADPEIELHIYTALSLELPAAGEDLQARLAEPILERLFGGVAELDYMVALRKHALPPNISVSEFYFKAGSMKSDHMAQRNYISSNYTHIARDIMAAGVNVLVQLVAARDGDNGTEISLSCNPDVLPEVAERLAEEQPRPYVILGQVNSELPFMEGDALVDESAYDGIVRDPAIDTRLFAVPNASVPMQDYATALHASSMVPDGGTLQIGIGSLGDAVAHALILRHQQNVEYRNLLDSITRVSPANDGLVEDGKPFDQGLYVSTEMFVNGMMHLIEQGVVKRRVYDNLAIQQGLNSGRIDETIDGKLYEYAAESGVLPAEIGADDLPQLQALGILPNDCRVSDGTLVIGDATCSTRTADPETRKLILRSTAGKTLRGGRILHGGFFLGPRDFYEKLSNLDDEGQAAICMTGVRRTNQLLLDPPLYAAQRQKARFINTGMIVTLTGAVASDALEDGTVISGVGGQYNFVAMAHDLPGARSILCIRATRGHGKALKSNIVPHYGHITIPKHLRDVIVTEYGIADLRGQSDSEIIKRLVAIADSRFQGELIDQAVKAGKLEKDWELPAGARDNTPQRLQRALGAALGGPLLPAFPFGTDLTDEEVALADSLKQVKALSEEPPEFVYTMLRALVHKVDEHKAQPFLERMGLDHPHSSKEFLIQQLLMLELEERGYLKVS